MVVNETTFGQTISGGASITTEVVTDIRGGRLTALFSIGVTPVVRGAAEI
jgi:predicted HAD superfamily phosphohydrolase YqeG